MRFVLCLSILVFSLILNLNQAWGQSDSLKKELQNAQQDGSRLDLLVQIGWETLSRSPEEALTYAQQAEPIAKKLLDPYRAAGVYRLFAFCYGDMNDRPNCLANHMKRIQILETTHEPSPDLCAAYYETAAVLSSQGQLDASETYYIKCSAMALEMDHKIYYAHSLIPLAEIKQRRGEVEAAKKDMLFSYKILHDANSPRADYVLSQLAELLISQDSLDAAESYLYPPVCLTKDTSRSDVDGYIFSGRGHAEFQRGNFKKAVYYYDLARQCWELTNSYFYLQGLYLNLADAYTHVNADSANLYYAKHLKLRDQVNTEDNNEKIAEMEARFKNQEKQKEIELLSKENEINGIEAKRQSQVNLLISIGLGVVIIFVIFLVTRIRIIRNQKNLINEQKEIVELKSREVLDSIAYAKRIQFAALPDQQKFSELFQNSFVIYLPKDQLSGDFYWMGTIEDQKKEKWNLVALGDCTGHGVPGALLSILGINYLNVARLNGSLGNPADILNFLNYGIHATFSSSSGEIRDGMDIAIAGVNESGTQLIYAAAKNPIYLVRKGVLKVLKGDKHAVGKGTGSEEIIPFELYTESLQKGDTVYLFSDGYADQFGGEKGKKYSYKRFRELLEKLAQKSLPDQKETLMKNFETWRQNLEQLDDVCIIGLRV